jgi:hypothetical protein
MRSQHDPLYSLFEQHLFNAMVEEETSEELIVRVVQNYLEAIKADGVIPPLQLASIENDLREEVLEMLRKKTYGHYSLSEFRKKAAQLTSKKNRAS